MIIMIMVKIVGDGDDHNYNDGDYGYDDGDYQDTEDYEDKTFFSPGIGAVTRVARHNCLEDSLSSVLSSPKSVMMIVILFGWLYCPAPQQTFKSRKCASNQNSLSTTKGPF